MTYESAVVQRNSSILTFAQEKDLAENTYKQLIDTKTKTPSERCIAMCSELRIELDKILLRKLDSFKEEFGDEDVARLHWKHHQKRRQKHLMRLAQLLNENDKNNHRFSSIEQSSFLTKPKNMTQ